MGGECILWGDKGKRTMIRDGKNANMCKNPEKFLDWMGKIFYNNETYGHF